MIMDSGGIKCWFYNFCFFLYGYFTKQIGNIVNYRWFTVCAFPLMIGIFYFYKKMAENFVLLAQLEFVFIPVLLFLIIYFARHFSAWFYDLNWPKPIRHLIISMSNLTFDIYIVQVYLSV